MNKVLVLTLSALSLAAPTLAQTVLYDATGGQKVSQYGGWIVNPLPLESFASGATVYDTTLPDNSVQGGFTRMDQSLNRSVGFALGFTMKLDSETHDGPNGANRAGVSVIVVTNDLMGIELGFWANRIWAQSGPGFTKAEEGFFNTTAALAAYNLQIVDGNYQLLANGTPIVSGILRNYSSFGAPYNIPNFMFFGDDTTSARGSFRTSRITLGGTAPEPTTLGLLTLGGLLWVRRRR